MRDFSLVSYHLGGFAFAFFYVFATWVSNNFKIINGTNEERSIIFLGTIFLEILLVFVLRKKLGRYFILALNSAFIISASLFLLIFLVVRLAFSSGSFF
jgi:hypothetical protein